MNSLEIVNRALDSMKKFKSKIYKLTDSDIRKIKKDLYVLYIIKKNFCYTEEFLSETPYLEGHCEISQKDREKIKKIMGGEK